MRPRDNTFPRLISLAPAGATIFATALGPTSSKE